MDTLIIGGGAAGLMAASFCKGHTVVIERLKAPGRKLLATGGGRCNLTHEANIDEIMSAFGRKARFMAPALQSFPPSAIRAFFQAHGVQTTADPDGCVFPVSQKAADVLSALERAARASGAEIRCGVRAKRLILKEVAAGEGASSLFKVAAVETDAGVLEAGRVILAAGGRSYPDLGSDGSGFELARQAGLQVTPTVPALAGLTTQETWPGTLTGIVFEHGALRLDVKGADKAWRTGPILFTHKGISGPPALDVSGEIAARLLQAAQATPSDGLATVPVRLSVIAGRAPADWLSLFDVWRREHGGRAVHNLLSGEIPRALAVTLCGLAEIPDTAVARARKAAMEQLASLCAELPLQISGTEGWNRAMLTRGGIELNELDARTLACKRIPNLFCAGEGVDLDGPCGGYNLTWAFASGRLAGTGTTRQPLA